MRQTGFNNYGWRQYASDIGRWFGMDMLAEHPYQISKSPYAFTWNNPMNFIDPDGNCPDCPSGYNIGQGWQDSNGEWWTRIDGGWKHTKSRVTYIDAVDVSDSYYSFGSSYWGWMFSTGGSSGSGSASGGYFPNSGNIGGSPFGGYSNNYVYTPPRKDSGDPVDDGYKRMLDDAFNWIKNHPKETTATAGIIEGSSQLVAKGLKSWNSPSSLATTKGKVIAGTISTRLPASAQTLGKASTALNVVGKTVGAIGIVNTGYQMLQGNISYSRGTIDLAMGVLGFFPATAPISLLYFGGVALYENYSGNEFLSKDEYY